MVLASGSRLMDLPGIAPVVAARTLADVGNVARFADRNRFASWTGTAPIEASSGEIVRHRLSRAANRRMNHMIHIAAATQIRLDTEGRAHYRRKLAAGKTRAEAMRCLKRRISDAIYRQLLADAKAVSEAGLQTGVEAGPGGHRGASLKSSAAGSHPHTSTSDQPLPGPAPTTLPARTQPGRATSQDPCSRPLTSEGCRCDAPWSRAAGPLGHVPVHSRAGDEDPVPDRASAPGGRRVAGFLSGGAVIRGACSEGRVKGSRHDHPWHHFNRCGAAGGLIEGPFVDRHRPACSRFDPELRAPRRTSQTLLLAGIAAKPRGPATVRSRQGPGRPTTPLSCSGGAPRAPPDPQDGASWPLTRYWCQAGMTWFDPRVALIPEELPPRRTGAVGFSG
jgi:Transposase IS116/IS110/IS902 family